MNLQLFKTAPFLEGTIYLLSIFLPIRFYTLSERKHTNKDIST